ncbi:MAG: hypothetical protein AAFV07_02940 [Bacteroidota bacterium]
MKKIILLPILVIGMGPLFAQNISELFLSFPDYNNDINPRAYREQILKYASSDSFSEIPYTPPDDWYEHEEETWRLTLDVPNGYLKLEMGYKGFSGGAAWIMEMVYWKKPDGTRLVGRTSEARMDATEVSTDLYFYQYEDGTWERLTNKDSVAPFYEVLRQVDTTATIAANKANGLDVPFPTRRQLGYATDVRLPRHGKAIKVRYPWFLAEDPYWDYELIMKDPEAQGPNRDDWIELPWLNGTFGEPDFSP